MVRPGITGWAQINGGNLITKKEKGALDDWYIRHASLWLDARIALLTLRVLFTGERRSGVQCGKALSTNSRSNKTSQSGRQRCYIGAALASRERGPDRVPHPPTPRRGRGRHYLPPIMAVIRPQIVITNFFWSVAFLG